MQHLYKRLLQCYKCDKLVNHPYMVCTGCNQLQHIPKMNYLELFEIKNPKKLPSNLKQRYIKLQTMAHPDKHNNEEIAQTMSSFVSNAFTTITNDFKRAEYCLKLHHIVIGDHDRIDQSFLITVMELQENKDKKKLEEMILMCTSEFWSLYDKHDFIKAKDALLKWKYLNQCF